MNATFAPNPAVTFTDVRVTLDDGTQRVSPIAGWLTTPDLDGFPQVEPVLLVDGQHLWSLSGLRELIARDNGFARIEYLPQPAGL
ncbi:hypothetical protein ACIA5A_05910 [Micromonospora sp. NPDC051300]|uniref:hypothetical protein n=1 Tax=Micromonospora sp. NPDC051300 TaxID=3364286 RepID=UPI0037A26E16